MKATLLTSHTGKMFLSKPEFWLRCVCKLIYADLKLKFSPGGGGCRRIILFVGGCDITLCEFSKFKFSAGSPVLHVQTPRPRLLDPRAWRI